MFVAPSAMLSVVNVTLPCKPLTEFTSLTSAPGAIPLNFDCSASVNALVFAFDSYNDLTSAALGAS